MLDLRKTTGLSIDSGFTINAPSCETGKGYIHLGARFPCETAVTIDSISVGSAAFAVSLSQHLIATNDSVLVTYTPAVLQDSSRLVFHLTRNGQSCDTSIMIYATAVSTKDAPAELTLSTSSLAQSISLTAGDSDTLSLRSRHALPKGLGIHTIHLALEVTGAAGINDIMPDKGWSISSAFSGGESLAATLTCDTSFSVQANQEIARIPIRTYITVDTSATAILTDYAFNPGEEFDGCLASTKSTDSVKIRIADRCGDDLLRRFIRTGSPLTIRSFYPDPASSLLHVLCSDTQRDDQYEVLNIMGQLILRGVIENSVVDVSQLHAGEYYLRVFHEGEVATRAFTVKRSGR